MALKVKRTGAAEYPKHLKMLLFGSPGSGKTRLSATAPSVLFASAEGGLMSVASQDVAYVDIKHSNDLLSLKNLLDQSAEVREKFLGYPVDTVVIDTLDEVQKILMNERMKSERIDQMRVQDWGWIDGQMQGIIRGFRDLDMNVIITCHLKEVSDGETGSVWYNPNLKGAIANDLAQYVDLSLLLQSETHNVIVDGKTEKVERRSLVTRPMHKYSFLKDRSGKLPAEMEVTFNGDFERIRDLVYADLSSMSEGASIEIDESQLKPPTLADFPVAEQPVQEKPKRVVQRKPVISKKDEVKAEPKEEVKQEVKVEPKAPEAPVAQKAADVPEATTNAANKLPEGIEATPMGYGTNLFCEKCGKEIETQEDADISRIRHRALLDKACYKEATANRKRK